MNHYKYLLKAIKAAAIQQQAKEFQELRVEACRKELEKAKKTKSGSWTFKVRTGPKYWHSMARQMMNELAQREGVTYKDLQVTVSLPERGRSFTKNRGETAIWANG